MDLNYKRLWRPLTANIIPWTYKMVWALVLKSKFLKQSGETLISFSLNAIIADDDEGFQTMLPFSGKSDIFQSGK